MEVTTVSPSAISPTEGHGLCETNVTNLAIHSVTLLIGLCGLVGNAALLCLLSLRFIGFIVFQLAVTDFLFLLFTVPSTLVFLLEDLSCSPIMPLVYVRFLFQLCMVSYYWLLFRLMHFKVARILIDLLRPCCCCEPSLDLWGVIHSALEWAFFVLITVVPAVTFLCPSREQELCRVSHISVHALILLLFAAPAAIFSTIEFIKPKRVSLEKLPKRYKIVTFLTVVFTLLLSLCNILHELDYIVVSSQVVFLLTCINSSIKPFIYILAGSSCWRHCTVGSLQITLQRIFPPWDWEIAPSRDAARDTVI